MNYDEAVRYLLRLGRELTAPRQARVQKFDLENIRALAEALGRPHLAVPCVHIAGTNGKGSTAAFLESILRQAGLRTGLYTSPHLVRINERIRLEGRSVSDSEFAASFTRVAAVAERLLASGALAAHPTFFECVTAMAFDLFARERLDAAILETGLGGRLDATNIVKPAVAVISQVDFDHEDYLGHSIEEIAAEKAGIIKAGCPVVSAAGRPEARGIIERRCREAGAEWIDLDVHCTIREERGPSGEYTAWLGGAKLGEEIFLAPQLRGRFQLRNAATAAMAARRLAEAGWPIQQSAIEEGVRRAGWRGRMEKLQERPAVYVDGAHNPAGAREVLAFWRENLGGRRILLVYGAMRDKAVDEIAGLLFPDAAEVILTEPRQSRAISVAELASHTSHLARSIRQVSDPGEALELALRMAAPEDVVFVAGSLYLVGHILEYWRSRKPAAVAGRPISL